MDSLGISSHVQILPIYAIMYSVGVFSSHFRRGWQVAAMAGDYSSGGGRPPTPSAPVRPAAVRRRQSTHRASAAGGQDPSPRRPLPALRAAPGRMHAIAARQRRLCSAPHLPRPQPSRALKPHLLRSPEPPESEPAGACCWEGQALLGLPAAPSSQIASHPDFP